MGYMERLGLWGAGNPAFSSFVEFMDAVGSRGVCALELVAMDMKAQGMYVARTLSYAGALSPVVTFPDSCMLWLNIALAPASSRCQGQAASCADDRLSCSTWSWYSTPEDMQLPVLGPLAGVPFTMTT